MKLDLSKDVADFLGEFKEPKKFRQVLTKILSMLKDPFPQDSVALKGYDGHRVTVGEYRIVYRYDQSNDLLQIVVIGKRNDDEVYKRL